MSIKENLQKLYSKLKNCTLCPNYCEVNRLKGEMGICKLGAELKVSSINLHFGEESVLVGHKGSGTIFLAGCNMKCIFCQNYDISHYNDGTYISKEKLIYSMFDLQKRGALNINFVTPTHFTPQIFEAVYEARQDGLNIPIVYNCGGYEDAEVIRLLDGLVDIYMPDFKYFDNTIAYKLSGVKNYVENATESIKEMHRQVGDLQTDALGIATQGLMVRHLVLPNNQASSKEVLDFLKNKISSNTYVNVMAQYRPCFKAHHHSEISRKLSLSDYLEVVDYAREIVLARGLER